MERLLFIAGPMAGQSFDLDRSDITLGREEGNVIRMVGDRCISRHHARIYRSGSFLYLEDLSSTNGTIVNGTRVGAAIHIVPGDTIQMAYHLLRVERAQDPVSIDPTLSVATTDLTVQSGLSIQSRTWLWSVAPLAVLGPAYAFVLRFTSAQLLPFALALAGIATMAVGIVRMYRPSANGGTATERAFLQAVIGGILAAGCSLWVNALR